MIKKILKLVLIAALGISFASVYATADVAKGQKLIIKKLKKPCGFEGVV